MEAQDRLEEELSEARQAMEAVQQQHDQLAADLQEATSSQPASRPEDAARIAQLSDQVSLLVMPICCFCICLRSRCRLWWVLVKCCGVLLPLFLHVLHQHGRGRGQVCCSRKTAQYRVWVQV